MIGAHSFVASDCSIVRINNGRNPRGSKGFTNLGDLKLQWIDLNEWEKKLKRDGFV